MIYNDLEVKNNFPRSKRNEVKLCLELRAFKNETLPPDQVVLRALDTPGKYG